MNVNKAFVVGRVTKDIEMRSTPSGQNVASFSIASNRYYKDSSGNKQESTEFHNIVLWSRLAEIANQYLVKGQEVLIEGRLQTRSWQGKDGNTRYTTEIVAENMQMGQKPGGGSSSASQSDDSAPPPPGEENNSAEPEIPDIPTDNNKSKGSSDDDEIKVEDIPF